MSDYIVAIPSYKRYDEITKKTLPTLKKGKVKKDKIYVFVANKQEEKLYKKKMDPKMYNQIVVGKKGIVEQRVFISKYFPEKTKIVSMDDDVEKLQKLSSDGKQLIDIKNLDTFFKKAFKLLEKKKLFIWGVYPVQNPFFMKNKVTDDLRFLIGVVHGYINRHNNKLYPNKKARSKEDYHQSILFYLHDGGVIRFNNITFKTKFNAPGGILANGDRFTMNDKAAKYLHEKYPKIVTRKYRKNGMPEINLKKNPQ